MPKDYRGKKPAQLALRYNGSGEYITSPVPIPAQDLDQIALMELAEKFSEATGEKWDAKRVMALLSDGQPGRRLRDGKPLYESSSEWACEDCDKTFKTWDSYNKHVLSEHVEEETRDKPKKDDEQQEDKK